jgi:hypothetical protein
VLLTRKLSACQSARVETVHFFCKVRELITHAYEAFRASAVALAIYRLVFKSGIFLKVKGIVGSTLTYKKIIHFISRGSSRPPEWRSVSQQQVARYSLFGVLIRR